MSYKMKTGIWDAMRADQELMKAGRIHPADGEKHPGINHDTFRGWDDYKEKLLQELEQIRKEKNT